MTTPHSPRTRRSPRLIAIGVLLVVLGGLGAAALYASLTNHRQVVVTNTDVMRGQELLPSHLTVREMPGDFHGGVSPDEINSLMGKRLLIDLPAGSYPEPRHVGDLPVEDDASIVGLKLTVGRIPSTGVVPGQEVQLVGLNDPATVVVATVISLPAVLDETTWMLDVAVANDLAPQVAALAARDELALVASGRP